MNYAAFSLATKINMAHVKKPAGRNEIKELFINVNYFSKKHNCYFEDWNWDFKRTIPRAEIRQIVDDLIEFCSGWKIPNRSDGQKSWYREIGGLLYNLYCCHEANQRRSGSNQEGAKTQRFWVAYGRVDLDFCGGNRHSRRHGTNVFNGLRKNGFLEVVRNWQKRENKIRVIAAPKLIESITKRWDGRKAGWTDNPIRKRKDPKKASGVILRDERGWDRVVPASELEGSVRNEFEMMQSIDEHESNFELIDPVTNEVHNLGDPKFKLRRIFHGSFDAGGRCYPPDVNLAREIRKRLLYREKSTGKVSRVVWLDLKCAHPRYDMHCQGVACPADPYRPDGCSLGRNLVKLVVTLSMGIDHRNTSRLVASVAKSIRESEELTLPDGRTARSVVEEIMSYYPSYRWCTAAWKRGSNMESRWMIQVRKWLASRQIPSRHVHDCIGVREEDVEVALFAMRRVYRRLNGHEAVIDVPAPYQARIKPLIDPWMVSGSTNPRRTWRVYRYPRINGSMNRILEKWKNLRMTHDNSINKLECCKSLITKDGGNCGSKKLKEEQQQEHTNTPHPLLYGGHLF